MRLSFLWLVALLWTASAALAQQQDTEAPPKPRKERLELSEKLDEALPRYVPREGGVEGTIEITCSPLTEPLLRRWADDFQMIYPKTTVEWRTIDSVHGARLIYGGDGVLFESTDGAYSVLDSSSGRNSWPVIVGFDRLEMIVHPNNPLPKLHVDEIGWVYTNQGKSHGIAFGGTNVEVLEHPRIDLWKDLETRPAPPLLAAPIHVYGREYSADDSGFLELRTVGPRAYLWGTLTYIARMPRDDIRIVQNAAAMVKAIAHDLHGIGYVSHSQLTERVRAVPVKGEPREDFRRSRMTGYPDSEDVPIEGEPQEDFRTKEQDEKQPYEVDLPALARPVFLWIEPTDEATRPLLRTEFLKYVLSRQGQKAVLSKGFFPLPATLAATQATAAKNLKKPPAPRTR